MTTVASTSLNAYFGHVLPHIGEKQKQVFEVIRKHGPVTNEQIASLLNWKINRVTGRTNELEDEGMVRVAYKAPCPITGYNAKHWVEVRDTLF